jgi:hypothetical protein
MRKETPGMSAPGSKSSDFFKTAVFSWPHVYDLSLLAGNYFFGAALGRGLFGPLMGQGGAVSRAIAWFYYCAIPIYIVGLILYMKPLRHCAAVAGVQKPKFTNADQAALMFTACIFGILVAGIFVDLAGFDDARQVGMAFALTGIFAAAGGLFFFLHYRAMAAAGTGGGMDRKRYYFLMGAGYLLMYPLVIGIFAPIDAIRMSLDIRLDSSPATGVLDVLLKAGVRGLMLSCMAWMLVWVIRRIASAPFGVRGRGWFFFLELSAYYMVMLVLRYYGMK